MSLTPREYATMPPDIAVKVGLELREYAALFCVDSFGNHVTIIGEDVDYLEMLKAAPHAVLSNLDIPHGKFPLSRAGWPDEWAGELGKEEV